MPAAGASTTFCCGDSSFCNLCGHRYTAEIHRAKNKSYYHCASREEHSNRNQNVEVAVLERQVEEQFKSIQFSPDFVREILDKLKTVSANHKLNIKPRNTSSSTSKRPSRRSATGPRRNCWPASLSDDAFVRLRTGFTEQLQGSRSTCYAESQRECDTDVMREILSLSENVYETYKKPRSP